MVNTAKWHHSCDSSLHLCQKSPIGMNLNCTRVTELFVHTTKSFPFHPLSLIYRWITSPSPHRYIILTICFHHYDWDLFFFERISSNRGLLIAFVSEQLTDSNIFFTASSHYCNYMFVLIFCCCYAGKKGALRKNIKRPHKSFIINTCVLCSYWDWTVLTVILPRYGCMQRAMGQYHCSTARTTISLQ